MHPRYLFHKVGGVASLCLIMLTTLFVVPASSVYAAAQQATPAQTGATQNVQAGTAHVVQRGDTLSAIARRYDTTVQALVNYNGLRTTTIYIGQRILIPNVQPAPTDPITYVVQRGDTLFRIAQRFGTTVPALMQVNHLPTTTIYAGQRLTISGPTDPNVPAIYHTVQRGETLSALARRYGVTVQAIMATNGLRSTTIYIGQRLLIPNRLGDPTPAPQPERQRIQFAPGATSATVTGTVSDPVHREYVVGAQGGQTMHVELVSDHGLANFSVQGLGDGQILKNFGDTVWTGVLPTTQDYLITILTMEFSTTNYSLFVEVSRLPAVGTTERIQFAPGAISATVAGYTSALEPRRYVLAARGDQTMTVALTVDNANAYITVLDASGNNLAGADGPVHNWTATLPVTGDYIVEVLNPGTGLANFSLTVTIQ